MAAPKRRGLEYKLICDVMAQRRGPTATWALAEKLGVPRSTAKRALESAQRKGLVHNYVADRSGGSGPSYSAQRMDIIDGSVKKVFLWDLIRTGKAGKKIAARCELPSRGGNSRYRISRTRPGR
jgi:hypothetical protein